MKVIHYPDAYGITAESLTVLRNTIAERMSHEIAVVEIPTGDIVCGFLIIDNTSDECIWTGDGFRTDLGGEGGAGYNTAQVLFNIWKIMPTYSEPYPQLSTLQQPETLLKIFKEIKSALVQQNFTVPMRNRPDYIRPVR